MFLLTGQLAEGGRQNFLIHGRQLRYIYLVRKVITSESMATLIKKKYSVSKQQLFSLERINLSQKHYEEA